MPPFDPKTGSLNAIIETPQKSRNKYKWDMEKELYTLSNVLPSGTFFPYDFGFIPSTKGEDGDPLDVLLIMDEPVFSGCLVPARLVGVIEAEEDGTRNDRLIAVAEECPSYKNLTSLCDMPEEQLHQICEFFVNYHQTQGKKFKILDTHGPKRAHRIVEGGQVSKDQESKNGKQESKNGKVTSKGRKNVSIR